MHRKKLTTLLAVALSVSNGVATAAPVMAEEAASQAVVSETASIQQAKTSAAAAPTAAEETAAPQEEAESTPTETAPSEPATEETKQPAAEPETTPETGSETEEETQTPETPEESTEGTTDDSSNEGQTDDSEENSGQTETPTPEPTPEPTPKPTPDPTPTPDPAPETDAKPENDQTSSGTSQTPADTTTPIPDAVTPTPTGGSLGINTYSGAIYNIHGGTQEKQQVFKITEEDMPGAYKTANLLVEQGYSKEAAAGIAGALIFVNNGHDIADPESIVKEITDNIEKKWNSGSDTNIHFTNIGYKDALITDVQALKEASSKEAALSFLASYEDYISWASVTKMDYPSFNEMTNTAAAKSIKNAYACYRGFFGATVDDEDPSYTSSDVRVNYTKIAKDYLVVKSDETAIYEEADTTSRTVGKAQSSTLLYRISKTGEFYYIESGDVRGFVKVSDVYLPGVSKRIVENKGEENMSVASASIVLSENKAASYEEKTVYRFFLSTPTDEEISDSAKELLISEEEFTNGQWIDEVMAFYGMNGQLKDTDITDTAATVEKDSMQAGNLVEYTEPEEETEEKASYNNTKNNEETTADTKAGSDQNESASAAPTTGQEKADTQDEEPLYAVYAGDGKYYTVSSDGKKITDMELSEDQIVSVYDISPEEEETESESTVITNHNIPYYNQGWFGGTPYNSGSVASDGCGITSFAMIASYVNDAEITPADAAAWGMANGANTVTSWGAFKTLAAHYGVEFVGQFTGPLYGGSADAMAQYLKDGYVLIGSHTGGYFNPSGSGHYIVYSGIDSNGNVYVNDPGNYEKSAGVSYSQADAFRNCKQYWVFKV